MNKMPRNQLTRDEFKVRVEKLKNEEAERLKREEKKEQERLKREEERLLQQAIDEENANKSTSMFKLILYALGIAILARIFVINFSDFFFG